MTIEKSFSIPFLVNGRPLTGIECLILIGSLVGLLASFTAGPVMAYLERATIRAISEKPAIRCALFAITGLSYLVYVFLVIAYYVLFVAQALGHF